MHFYVNCLKERKNLWKLNVAFPREISFIAIHPPKASASAASVRCSRSKFAFYGTQLIALIISKASSESDAGPAKKHPSIVFQQRVYLWTTATIYRYFVGRANYCFEKWRVCVSIVMLVKYWRYAEMLFASYHLNGLH